MRIFETRNDLIKIFEKNLIVCEIGVFKGDFSKILLETLSPKELHLVDIFDGMMCSGDKDGNNIIWTNLNEEYENIKKTFEQKTNVNIHKGNSFDILSRFPNDYFDIIYIDGDHSYDAVKKDLEISKLKVKTQGFICGHDYSKVKFIDVYRAVNEFCDNNKLEISLLTNDGCPTYGIIKK